MRMALKIGILMLFSLLPAVGSQALDIKAYVDKACLSCHTLSAGAPDGVGPNLFGVFNRPVAGSEGFKYSPALKKLKSDRRWTETNLRSFLSDPQGFAPGTDMTVSVHDKRHLDAVIKYLSFLK